jgi:hypothetical protein
MSDIKVFLEFKIPGRSTAIVDSTYGSEAFVDISNRVDFQALSWQNVSSSNTATAKVRIFTVDPIDTSDYTTFSDPAGNRDSLTTAVSSPNWYFDVADRAELRIHDISGGAAVQDHQILFSGVVTRVSIYREPGFIIQELEVGDAMQLLSENIITKYYHPADSHADDAISNATAITHTVTNYSSLPIPEAGAWNGIPHLSTSSSGLRKNIILNPSFETDTSGWVGASATIAQSTAQFFSGADSLLVTGTAAIGSGTKQTGAYKPVVVGATSYALAGRVRLVTGTTTAQIQASIEWYDSGNTLISTSTAGASVIPTSSGWSVVFVSGVTSPSNAVYAAPRFITDNAVAANWYLDGVQMEAESFDATVTYFDGSTASAGGTTGERAKTTSDGRRYRLDQDPTTLFRSWVYATIFDATNDPTRFDSTLNRSTYVEEIVNGSYRFSPYFANTGTYLPEQRGGRTLLQAIQEMATNEGAAYWVDPGSFDVSGNHVRNLHYSSKEINNLVSNSVFEDGLSTGWNLTEVGAFAVDSSTSGPFSTGYSVYANGSTHSDAVMATGSRIATSFGDVFFVSWRVKTGQANKSHPHVRYYHADGSVHGNSHGYQIAATQAVEGRWTRQWGIIATPSGGSPAVTHLAIVLHHEAHSSAYQVNYTDIKVVKVTSAFGFSDEPTETGDDIPLRDFEVPSAPKESGVVANRVLVYGIYKSVDASNGQTVMLTGGTGEPIRYLSFDYVQGVWQSGGKIIESVIVDPLVQTGDDAQGRAQAFFNENGLPLISYQFKHTTNGLEIGDVVPFIWNAVGVAEPLIVKSQNSYMIGQDVYYEVQLGGDIQIQKSTVLALQKAIDEINETPITDLGPLAPENVVGATASGAITVTWDYDFSHARNEGLANFEIYRSEGGGTFNLVNTTQATAWSDSAGDSGLDVNQTYQYQVRAVDIDGFYSEMSVASPPVSPGAVDLDGAFDDAYNGLGVDVPKIVTSITYAGTPSIKTITSIARTSPSSTVTVTSNAHGFGAGNVVVITGTGVSTFDGTYTIATVTTNTFTYTTTATTTNSASVGKASAYSVSGAYVDNDGVSRNLGDAFSLIQFPKGQLAMSRTDGKLYRNGTTSLTGVTSPWDDKWTRAATDAIDVGPGGTVSITADLITTGTLNAAQVSVTNLDAVSITAGTLTLTGLNATAISSTGFTVTNAGVVTATGANISGAITATSGFIGNWDIGANSISNLNSGIYTGLYHSTSTGGVSFHAGSTGVDGTGAKFKVLNDGSMTAGNGQFTVDSAGNITAKSGYYNPDGKPAIMLQGSSTEGDIAVPNTTAMSFGNYNPSTFAFNEQMRLDTNGNLGVYDGYISAATSITAGTTISATGDITTSGSLVSNGGDVFIDGTATENPTLTFRNSGNTVLGTMYHDGTNFHIDDATGTDILSVGQVSATSLSTSGSITATGSVNGSNIPTYVRAAKSSTSTVSVGVNAFQDLTIAYTSVGSAPVAAVASIYHSSSTENAWLATIWSASATQAIVRVYNVDAATSTSSRQVFLIVADE